MKADDKILREILFNEMSREGVKEFTVPFDGSGDSGSVNQPDLDDKILGKMIPNFSLCTGTFWNGTKNVETYNEKVFIEDLIIDICYKLLASYWPGWEINEGSYGTFTFDVDERKVSLEFHEIIQGENLHAAEFE